MIKFGTAGVPLSAADNSTGAGIKRIRELGLDAMEVEFVHGVRMKEEKARLNGQTAIEEKVALTCHAPYYVNLNSKEEEKIIASKQRLVDTARTAEFLGAQSIIFHPAFYSGDEAQQVFSKVLAEIAEIRGILDKESCPVILRPETTGKPSQFGSLEETIALARELNGVLPCIDFSHLHARSNGLFNSYDEFCSVLDMTAESLGDKWAHNAHFHISGIEYGPKGEKKHLIFEEADLNYQELLRALISFGIKGTIICESPNLEKDTLLLQETYKALV